MSKINVEFNRDFDDGGGENTSERCASESGEAEKGGNGITVLEGPCEGII